MPQYTGAPEWFEKKQFEGTFFCKYVYGGKRFHYHDRMVAITVQVCAFRHRVGSRHHKVQWDLCPSKCIQNCTLRLAIGYRRQMWLECMWFLYNNQLAQSSANLAIPSAATLKDMNTKQHFIVPGMDLIIKKLNFCITVNFFLKELYYSLA